MFREAAERADASRQAARRRLRPGVSPLRPSGGRTRSRGDRRKSAHAGRRREDIGGPAGRLPPRVGLICPGRIRPGSPAAPNRNCPQANLAFEISRLSTDAAACPPRRGWRIASPVPGRVAFGFTRTAMIALFSPIRTRIETKGGIVITRREVPGRLAPDDVPGTPPGSIRSREQTLIREIPVLQRSRVIENAVAGKRKSRVGRDVRLAVARRSGHPQVAGRRIG